jgi:hypothetical protein
MNALEGECYTQPQSQQNTSSLKQKIFNMKKLIQTLSQGTIELIKIYEDAAKVMRPIDFVQVGLALLGFAILIIIPSSRATFWGFTVFTGLGSIILVDILTRDDKTGLWLWTAKTITYIILCWKFSHNMGTFHMEYVIMLAIALSAFIVSRRYIPVRAIALWGQNFAYTFGAYMYIKAVYHYPEEYGAAQILFWTINAISYALMIWEIDKYKKPSDNLIIPVFALVVCLIYITLIAWL